VSAGSCPRRCAAGQTRGSIACAAGMSDDERATLDAMRAREDELEGVLAAQEDALRAHQRQVWEHQAARARMQAEWDALQGRVRGPGQGVRFARALRHASCRHGAGPMRRIPGAGAGTIGASGRPEYQEMLTEPCRRSCSWK
jgi:uncharacterized coiled-coil protein SlyX